MSQTKTRTSFSVSIIIPVHRIDKTFNECINSVINALRMDDELIVVADGVDIKTLSFLSDRNIKILSTGKISGPAIARNLGGQTAKGDLLFFVDSDVSIPPDTIKRLIPFFYDEDIKAVIGSYDDNPSAPNFISQYKNLFHHYVHQSSKDNASTFWGACGVIRKDIFIAIGGYDENYAQPSIEDIDLGYKIINAGHKIFLCKNLQVKHFKKWTFISLLKTDFFNRAIPWTKLMFHNNRFLNDLNLKNSSRLSVVIIFLFIFFLLGSFWLKDLLIFSIVSGLSLLILNFPLYSFFHKKKGLLFALRVIPMHWLYFFYSGIAFVTGTILFKLENLSNHKIKPLPAYLRKPIEDTQKYS